MKRMIGCVLAALLCACAAAPATETPYNQGVAAYKVKDYREAMVQWSIAAESGNIDAMNNLAFLMFNGFGAEARRQQAIELWRFAASKGQSESQWHLGNAYAEGSGVEQDLVSAYAWYRCSIESAERRSRESGDKTEDEIAQDARKSLVEITDKLSGGDLERGRQLAAQYIAQYAPVIEPAAPVL
jgi:hypothetical protein